MKSISFRFKGVIQHRAEAAGLLQSPGDAVLIERGRPRLLLISCPCGCGDEFPINLDQRSGRAWRLYRNDRKGLSLFPSVWRESGCESHYVIWRDQILLLGGNESEFENKSQLTNDDLYVVILEYLPVERFVNFSEIAEALNEVPWDVLLSCRELRRRGLVREGENELRGSFGRMRQELQ